MKNIFKYILLLSITLVLISTFSINVKGLSVNKAGDSIRFEILLHKKMLNDSKIDVKFIESIEITSSQLLMLSSSNQFYLLGLGGIAPVSQKENDTITSFAYTSDGLLMIVRNNELCYIDTLGKLAKLYTLPSHNMKISAGKKVMYLFDSSKNKKKYIVYSLAHGGRYNEILVTSTPINAVAETKNQLLFSTGSALYSYNLNDKKTKALVNVPNNYEIKSIAVDTLSGRIYFSTNNAVYALKDSLAVAITDKFTGSLKYYNNSIMIINSEKQFIVRIIGLEDKIKSVNTAKPQEISKTVEVLTNESVIKMVNAKLSDEMIINIINKSEVNFNTDVNSMINLSNQQVSSAVIMAMKNAMKAKNNK